MTDKKERFDEFISETSNHDVFLTQLEDNPEQSELVIFFEDRKFKEKELFFKLNWN